MVRIRYTQNDIPVGYDTRYQSSVHRLYYRPIANYNTKLHVNACCMEDIYV